MTECIRYTEKKCKFPIWDVDKLEGFGLPHENQDMVLLDVKNYLPLRWVVANKSPQLEDKLRSDDSFKKPDLTVNASL